MPNHEYKCDYPGVADDFGTIHDLMRYMIDNRIPTDAVISYAGCGSHNIMFTWGKSEIVDWWELEDDLSPEEQEKGLI